MREGRSTIADRPESARLKALEECPIFEGLTAGDLKDAWARSVSVRYAKGSFIFTEGDAADFFLLAQEGLIKLCKESPSGKSVIFSIATTGDTLMPPP